MKQSMMRPQDIVILLKIISFGKHAWMKIDIAEGVGVSPAEITVSLERSRIARLIDEDKKRVNTAALSEFIRFGIQYVFPVVPQAPQRGIGTMISSPALKGIVADGNEKYVWPSPNGKIKGIGIEPLYKTVPAAVSKDENLYEMLSLVDCFRFGRAREKEYASTRLKEIFEKYEN